jgi:acyl-CoA synthetase (AMP-forming)/AMP-acid ligase II
VRGPRPLSLFHALGHGLCLVGVVATGASARIMIDPATADVLAALRTNQFTFFTGVPTTYHKLVQAAAGKVGPSVSSLRVCVTAGAPSTPELYHSVERVLGVPLLNGYGSTETCGGVATSRPEGPLVAGACGPPLTGLDIRFTDPASGLDVPPGDEGEIWVRGPSLMLGYHNQPEATAAVLRDGWYRTGDLGRLVQHDQVAVTGRIKELIIRGGENLHPAEVEEVLLSCPEVVDAVVVGKPHGVLGEVPVAYVAGTPDGFDPGLLLSACRQRLSSWKVPEEIYAVEAIPRTSTGKIARRAVVGLPATRVLPAAASGRARHGG